MWNRTENKITMIMIRHGATLSNKEQRYLGKTDEALSDEGRVQLLKNKREHRYPKVTQIFMSPMKRCVETAEYLYPTARKVSIKEWEEMDFGDFEGKNYLDLKDDVRYQEWIDSNGTLPFPNGESREIFTERCKKGFEKMLDHLNQMGNPLPEKIGLIVHGGTIMSVLNMLCKSGYFEYQVANGEGYRCICSVSKEGLEKIELERL